MNENGVGLVKLDADLSMSPTPRGARSVAKREKYSWNDPGEEGEFRWVAISELHIDKSYQRGLVGSHKVSTIRKEFSWALFGALHVGRRPDGTLFVFDGQHRAVAALYRDDIDRVPCMVFDVSGVTEEARAFIGVNTTQSTVQAFDRHRAGLTAEEDVDLDLKEAVEELGYTLVRSGDADWTIRCVGTLRRYMDRDPERTTLALSAAAELCGGRAIRADVLKGLYWVAGRDDGLGDATHMRRLRELDPEMVEIAIDKAVMREGTRSQKVCGTAIGEILNKRRRSRALDLE